MNRFDRVSAILIMLQTKKWVTANEISQRFEVSVRTIYRDIRTLQEAGIPIGAEAGKGYFIVDGFHLPPVMFTPDEAASLLLAGKLIEKMSDKSIGQGFKSALEKICAILPDKEKGYIDNLDKGIEVFYNSSLISSKIASNILSEIQRALANKFVINIEYQSLHKNENLTNRSVEPIVLCFYSMHWHLIAYCRLRNEFRDFRVDRIKRVTPSNEICPKREIQNASQYFSRLGENEDLKEIILRVDKKTAAHLSTSKYYYGFISETEYEDYYEMHLISSDLDYTARWLLTFTDGIEIISPQELRDKFIDLIKTLNNRFL
ncbi:MAG: YafY family transcriptional regulator [Bacteroidales bacterium]|nr:MAG: YafY family transcriptional regulator [Bacteroidales bacterium]